MKMVIKLLKRGFRFITKESFDKLIILNVADGQYIFLCLIRMDREKGQII